jgi:hypothetical protein
MRNLSRVIFAAIVLALTAATGISPALTSHAYADGGGGTKGEK